MVALSAEPHRLVANPLIVLREEFDDWAILFDPDSGGAFGLNPTSVFIWKLLDGNRTSDEIAAEVHKVMEAVPDTASDDVCRFLQSLQDRGLAGYVHLAGEEPRFQRNIPKGPQGGS